jgi:uroporphyrinogen-III decarboxylase
MFITLGRGLYFDTWEARIEVDCLFRNDRGFLSSCGTPIAFGTPPENVKALIDTAKEYRS